MIFYTAADLIWATRIKGTGESLGISCRPVRSLSMLEDRLIDGGVTALILDLEAWELSASLAARLKGPTASDDERAIRIVAFGPHVRADLFEQIREAGADDVVTRGAFDGSLPEILRSLSGI